MTPEEIRNCTDLDHLEAIEEEAYKDCVYFNDCSICDRANVDDKCDLILLSRRTHELRMAAKEIGANIYRMPFGLGNLRPVLHLIDPDVPTLNLFIPLTNVNLESDTVFPIEVSEAGKTKTMYACLGRTKFFKAEELSSLDGLEVIGTITKGTADRIFKRYAEIVM